jgi:hypothetical protein
MTQHSRHQPHRSATGEPPIWTPDRYPALTDFCRGYLHEDAALVHGSADAAAAAFRSDASPEERASLLAELDRLTQEARTRTASDLQRFVTTGLGSRWTPASANDLARLAGILRRTTP